VVLLAALEARVKVVGSLISMAVEALLFTFSKNFDIHGGSFPKMDPGN
jgi:hypothetical protein